jgi:hypothetical protein
VHPARESIRAPDQSSYFFSCIDENHPGPLIERLDPAPKSVISSADIDTTKQING